MRTSIVTDLLFGDAGKGLTTSFLSSRSNNPLIVRFSGGHNCGHTVVHNGKRHVFSSFGSGTLQGASTFISHFCTFYPIAVWNEYCDLKRNGIIPKLFIDPLAMVTTPYDHMANQINYEYKNNGTVGVGIGTTIQRHEAYYKLYVQDLLCETVLDIKMNNIRDYYINLLGLKFDEEELQKRLLYWNNCITMLKSANLIGFKKLDLNEFDHIIFEGAQGIMLCQDYGFFPNVTRSNTTSKNAMNIIEHLKLPVPDIYYISRLYSTRHGAGAFPTEQYKVELINNENETNIHGEFQGKFRTGALDLDLINYALLCDEKFINPNSKKSIVFTCLDQIKDHDNINYVIDKRLQNGKISDIRNSISQTIDNFLFSSSEDSIDMIDKYKNQLL